MSEPSEKRRRWLTVLIMLVGAGMGYAWGRMGAGHSDDESGKSGRSSMRETGGAGGRRASINSSTSGDLKRWPATKEYLIQRWNDSPFSYYDWRLRGETHRLLKNVPPAELGAYYEELRAADLGRTMNSLHDCVLQEWVIQNGEGAVTALLPEKPDPMSVFGTHTKALAYWSSENPAEVLAWMKPGLPPALASQEEQIRQSVLVRLASKDFSAVERELASIQGDRRTDLLAMLGYAGSNSDPQLRQHLLEMIPSLSAQESSAALGQLMQGWSRSEPQEAAAALAKLKIPHEVRREADVELAVGQSFKAPDAALKGWIDRNAGQTELPDQILGIVDRWVVRNPEEVRIWVESLSESQMKEVLETRAADRAAKGSAGQ